MSISEFQDALAAAGLAPPRIIADGKMHRFPTSEGRRDDAGWYVLHIDGDSSWGGYGDHRRGLKEGWSSLKGKKISAADRQRMDAAQKKAKAQAAKEEKTRTEKCRERAKFIWEHSGIAEKHPYLEKKGIKPFAAHVYKQFLAVPLFNDGEMQSLQLIGDAGKKFLFGTKKQGSYLVLGEIADRYLICEGWATGCSLHEATKLPVVVAWDAYNLIPVAKIFKKLYPDAQVTIAGDNDYGKAENVGAKCAGLAAEAVGGVRVQLPLAIDEPPGRLSIDWNDLHALRGLDAVRDAFFPPAGSDEAPPMDNWDGGDEPPFRVLGYDRGTFYYLPRDSDQIVELSASAHTLPNLLRLAPMAYWIQKYGDLPTSKVAMASAQNALFRQCTSAGVFKAEQRLRGAGAWLDEGRHILHCGNVVYVDGDPVEPSAVPGDFIYEKSARVLTLRADPLPNKEAHRLREICETLQWFNPLSGSLLAGWCVVAPVCAMLPWRPHVWITGEAQSGKTVVLRDVVLPMVGKMALRVDGGTTEASLRQMLGHDGRPVIYDEAEAESKKDQNIMENVLMLARKSSSGGVIMKGSTSGDVITFNARSAYCFSGINPSVKQRADESRISFLHLCKDNGEGREDRYAKWQEKRTKIITKEYADRMLARTVANLSTLIENCEVFTNAAALVLNDRRAADQIGVMLAGLYLLGSTQKVTFEKAKEWILQHDWTYHTATAEALDYEMLIEFLSTTTLRVALDKQTKDIPIGNLINCAGGRQYDPPQDIADKELRRVGVVVKNNRVFFANKSSKMAKLLEGQPWVANWRRVLGDMPGAINESTMHFFPGWKSRAVSIPFEIFGREN